MALPLAGAKILAADLATIFPLGVDAATPYTPVWTSSGTAPAIGNGSLAGLYWRVGRRVVYRWALTMGASTTYGTGTYYISLPILADPGWAAGLLPIGRCSLVDASVGTRANRDVAFWDAGRALMISEAGAAVGQTVPWTWAVGDTGAGGGSYMAAA